MESQKRIKIIWGTSVQAASFRQTIVNHNTGTARTWEKTEPGQWKQQGTVLGNPKSPEHYYSERKSVGTPRREDYKIFSASSSSAASSSSSSTSATTEEQARTPTINQDEYDTSQL